MSGMNICAKCGSLIVENEVHVCSANTRFSFNPVDVGLGNPANILVGFDTRTEEIKKLNDELENIQTESKYKDDYIIKLKKRNKKLLDKIQELCNKYMNIYISEPEKYDEELLQFLDDLLSEIVNDIDLLKEFVRNK